MTTQAEFKNAATYTLGMAPGGRSIVSRDNPPKSFVVLDDKGLVIVRVPVVDALRAARDLDVGIDVPWFVEMCKPKKRRPRGTVLWRKQ